MVKVGDFVRRGKGAPMYRVTEVFPTGWFNHDGPVPDYSTIGGCHPAYWEIVHSPEPAPTARKNDPATSKGKKRVNKYELCVLTVLGIKKEGATGKEIAAFSGEALNSLTPRFAPLRRKGLIKDSGVRRDKQIVWVLA